MNKFIGNKHVHEDDESKLLNGHWLEYWPYAGLVLIVFLSLCFDITRMH